MADRQKKERQRIVNQEKRVSVVSTLGEGFNEDYVRYGY